MKKLTLFAVGLTLAGSLGANAGTLVFDPGASGPDTITNPGFTNFVDVDLNQDGYRDIELGIGGYFNTGGFVNALSDTNRFVGGPPPGVSQNLDGSFDAPYQEVYISSTNGIADLFSAGDEVGANTFGTDSGFEDLFDSPSDNAIPNVGDKGYLGFRIDIGTANYVPVDGFLPTGFNSTPMSFYAFLHVEHGSLIFGQAGYNNVAGAPAVIPGGNNPPPIPLPAGFPLLLTGLGLFAFAKRRKT